MAKLIIPPPSEEFFIHHNKYGFKIKVNHESIKPLYDFYKERKNISLHYPVSDKDRHEFENGLIDNWTRRGFNVPKFMKTQTLEEKEVEAS